MRLLHCVFLGLAVACSVPAQTYTISTYAGGGPPVNVPGTSAYLAVVRAVAVDGAGNVFLTTARVVLRLDAITGILSLVAGNGTDGFSGDNGPATSAQLNGPYGVAVDSAGNLYIADRGNNRIRKVSNGVITTVAGNGTFGFSGDNGPATSAQLSDPPAIAVDTAGSLYIADTYNHRIRKVSDGVITTVAGNGTAGFSGDDGPATSAQLSFPWGVAVDTAGDVYIADSGNHCIRKVSAGVITTVAGNGTRGLNGDNGPATSAQLSFPWGVAVDSAGNVYIADSGDNRIRKVSAGVITTVAGNGTYGFSGDDGPATSAQLNSPQAVTLDSAGNLYIADSDDLTARIRKISGGVITTVAGGSLGDGWPAISARLWFSVCCDGQPEDLGGAIAADSVGNVYIADSYEHRIRKVSGGVITTVAGNGTPGFSGDDGPATSAQLSYPSGVAVDAGGNLYIADSCRVRKVTDSVITTVAGNGKCDFSGDDGPATSAQVSPHSGGIAVDSAGNLYITDYNRIRKVSNGVITTVAGNGMQGFNGDNGPATSARLSYPTAIAVDSAGNVYIADTSNSRIRKVSGGVITTVAGGGVLRDDGPATSAGLVNPMGVAVDLAGDLYIADTYSARIRKVSNGVITTVAGTGTRGFSGDNGPATSAQLYGPYGVAVDSAGNIYVVDAFNNRVRILRPQPASSGATNGASDRSSGSSPRL